MKIINFIGLILFTITVFAIIGCNNTQKDFQIESCKCEYLENPIGIDSPSPRFSWKMTSSQRGQHQTAFQVLVAGRLNSLEQELGDLWDSGKVESSQSIHVPYNGTELQSNQTCYWQVRIWDKDGIPSSWSKPAQFTTGIYNDWTAKWIGKGADLVPDNEKGFYDNPEQMSSKIKTNEKSVLLRKDIAVSGKIKRAIVNVSGLGLYELSLNGIRVGDKLLNPAKTQYRQRVLYDVYNVTDLLQSGDNAIGIELGNGWFSPLKKWWSWRMQWFGSKRAILQLHIDYMDGKTETIITDNTWKTADGPTISSCIYDGEIYNANLEKPGWNTAGFNDANWESAQIVSAPGGVMTSQIMEPVKITQTLKPVLVTEPEKGVFVYDMGQNFAGWARVEMTGTVNTKVTLQYAENLQKTGLVDITTNNLAAARDVYILKGYGIETYEPRFTFHGFRYVQITAEPSMPEIKSVTGCMVHSACEQNGFFETGNAVLNKIQQATLLSQRGNMVGYPSDCPQRDERLGWLGDAHVSAEQAMYNFHTPLFFINWLNSVQSGQVPQSGDIPYIVPRPSSEPGTPAWSSAYILMIWYHYLNYGDQQLLTEHYTNMKAYLDYLTSTASNYILPPDKYGDWVSVDENWDRGKPESVATFYYYYNTLLLGKIADILDNTQDLQKYQSQAEKIKSAYHQTFFNTSKNIYEDASQYAITAPLFVGITPDELKESVLDTLVNNIIVKNQGHLTTGILGTKYIMELLSNIDENETAYLLATQTGYPGWYDLVKSRTTLSEHWDQSGSNNHIMFGSISSWFYKVLAGIQADESQPGFKHIIIKPYIQPETGFVNASVKTMYGTVKSNWKCDEKMYRIDLSIPVNTTATVFLPAPGADTIYENKNPAAEAEGVQFLEMEGEYAVFEIGSGDYSFTCENIEKVIDKPAVTNPEITPDLQYFFKPEQLTVTLQCGSQNADIYYTLDGSEPTQNATLYKESITLSTTTMLKARSFKPGCKPGMISYKLFACIDPELNGVNYQLYNGTFDVIPDFSTLTPDEQGHVFAIDLENLPITVNEFATQYTGYIEIKQAGSYTFYCGSNDGSMLYIDDKLVVDNGSGHAYLVKSGVVQLDTGKHKIRTTYFQKGGAKALDVSYKGPGIDKQIVPALVLFRE